MKIEWRWPALAVLIASGFAMTYAASETLRETQRKAWKAEAAQAAQWLSSTVLNWLEQGYAPVSALAMLFEGSSQVDEAEFLAAVDALESRATAYFIDTLTVLRPRTDESGWRIEFSSDPRGPLPAGALLAPLPTLDVAQRREGQMILGPSIAVTDAVRYSLLALATRDAHGPLVILALIRLDAMMENLFQLHGEGGLEVLVTGRFLQADGPGREQVAFGAPAPDAEHSVTTRTVSGGADLSITWFMDSTFRMGPNTAQADLTSLFGSAGTLLGAAFVAWLMLHSRIVERKVVSATAALSEKERQFRNLLESAPDPMVVVDGDGAIVMVNRQTEQLFGYDREELRGRPIEELMPEQYRAGHSGKRRHYVTDPEARPMGAGLELFALTKDGREIPVEVSLSSTLR